MRIKQFYCHFGIGFKEGIRAKYGLTDYEETPDRYAPLLMVGCYNFRQIGLVETIVLTSPLVVILWCGSDAESFIKQENQFWFDRWRENPQIKHIAASHWIADDLDKIGFKYVKLPITLHDYKDIKPAPLGDSVYMYKPGSKLYNGGIYQEIKEVLPYNIIEAVPTSYSREEMMEVYKNCFIGLRFTEHDGLSETVCEMGLMGRMVIHNGDTPNCIHYDKENIDEIINAIHFEWKHAAMYNKTQELAKQMQGYLNIGEDFLNTDYYV